MSDFILNKEHIGKEVLLIDRSDRGEPKKLIATVVKINPKTVVLDVKHSETWARQEKLYKSEHLKNKVLFDRDYSGGYSIYLSEKEYDDQIKANNLRDKLRDVFGIYGQPNYSLEQLEQVASILGLTTTEE